MRPRLVLEGTRTRVPAGQPEGSQEATRRLKGLSALEKQAKFLLGNLVESNHDLEARHLTTYVSFWHVPFLAER